MTREEQLVTSLGASLIVVLATLGVEYIPQSVMAITVILIGVIFALVLNYRKTDGMLKSFIIALVLSLILFVILYLAEKTGPGRNLLLYPVYMTFLYAGLAITARLRKNT